MSSACLQHASNPVTSYCVRCGRPMCDLCAFWVGTALFCPECLGSGPSADERSSVTVRGFLSIGLAVLAVVTMIGNFAAVRLVPPQQVNLIDQVLTKAASVIGLGGLALGLIGREGARRTGSILPLVGVVGSAIVVGVVLLLSLSSLFQG